MLDFADARRRMVARQLRRRGVKDTAVLDAMASVPRERFVEPSLAEFAYEDSPLPIGHGQTISQPYIVARMIELAQITPGDNVLEIGAGSGYAAAIMSQFSDRVVAIEWNDVLAEQARLRLNSLGCENIRVVSGDGSRGRSEDAPFDAIVVSAGGPAVPPALKDQLDIGGRLVMPVGEHGQVQRLLRLTRTAATRFEEEDFGGVVFVPLVSDHATDGPAAPGIVRPKTLPEHIAASIEQLPPLDLEETFAETFERFADRRVVLLGEASHGTSEFYRARAAITKRLIERHGFSIVAIEADWPDAASVDRYVRGRAADRHPPFRRFPTWMWRNVETERFLTWLRDHNASRADDRQASFYGLDLYNLTGSIATVLAYLDDVDPEAASVARERYGCLTPWQNEPSLYGRVALSAGYGECEEAVIRQCRDMLERQPRYAYGDGEAFFDAAQSARLIASAERYYRVMYYGGAQAWNLRDRHMFDTLGHLLDAKGSGSKAVVWAHNSHIGDARETEMGRVREEINIGQLCRERYGDAAALIGFGTHSGTVAAASEWDGDMEVKKVNPSLDESVECCFHLSGARYGLMDFTRHDRLSEELATDRLERFIGVIYRPETERLSHYVEASLSGQFDAYVWFDETTAVTPLGAELRNGSPDMFPFGV
jgi:protein-L-isoaspartate(D-aspartate) O-methyltransferase